MESEYRSVALEQAQLATRKFISDDILGRTVDVNMILEHTMKGQILELRAAVTAAKRTEGPYTLTDEIEDKRFVPRRPVRDGVLLWLSRHVPTYPLQRFFLNHAQIEEIPLHHKTVIQTIHYYGCPHVKTSPPRTHFEWMGIQSGQIPIQGE